MPDDDEKVLHRLRFILRGLLGLGLAGTGTELLLIGHHEISGGRAASLEPLEQELT